MSEAYGATAVAVVALNVLAGLLGAGSWKLNRPSIAFWYLLRIAQAATLVFVLFEGVLWATAGQAEDGLHYLYAFLPVVAMFLAEGMRGASASQELGERDFGTLPESDRQLVAMAIVRRETGVMTVSTFVVAFLVWRAAITTAGIF